MSSTASCQLIQPCLSNLSSSKRQPFPQHLKLSLAARSLIEALDRWTPFWSSYSMRYTQAFTQISHISECPTSRSRRASPAVASDLWEVLCSSPIPFLMLWPGSVDAGEPHEENQGEPWRILQVANSCSAASAIYSDLQAKQTNQSTDAQKSHFAQQNGAVSRPAQGPSWRCPRSAGQIRCEAARSGRSSGVQ